MGNEAPEYSEGAAPEPVVSAPAKPAAASEIEAIFCPGDRIGGYEIEKVLGIGSLAVVYGATQLSLNRHVALKVPLGRLNRHPLFAQQFERDAGRIAALSHPNLVNILDSGRQGDLHYFVLEHVDGVPLETAIVRGILSYGDYLAVIRQVREALKYVHGESLLHLDVKPSNILLSRNGQVKIGDFAVARMALAVGEEGSPAGRVYRAPELRARRAGIDARADVYSLGITYHRMFCRAFPENGQTRAAVLNPALPKAVDGVLQEAVAPHPEDRYESAQRFTVELLSSLMGMAAFFQIDNIVEESEQPTDRIAQIAEARNAAAAELAAAAAATRELATAGKTAPAVARIAAEPPAAPLPAAASLPNPVPAVPAAAAGMPARAWPRIAKPVLWGSGAFALLAGSVMAGFLFFSSGGPSSGPTRQPPPSLTSLLGQPIAALASSPSAGSGVLLGWLPSNHSFVQKALAEGKPVAIYFRRGTPSLPWADFEATVLGSPAVLEKLDGVIRVVEDLESPKNPALARYGKGSEPVLSVVGPNSRSIARFHEDATPDQILYALTLM